ncbi:MAG: hypothetical protein IKB34_05110 [Clostridia bacterium]|nr:hypothetical protein [Clostridia bacterium]
MKKNTVTLIIALLCIVIFSSVTALTAMAATQTPLGSPAPGGEVTTTEELVAALGGEQNASIGKDGYTVYLSKDILLNGTIHITEGIYRIVGRGCTVYRGFTNGAMFQLTAVSLTDKDGQAIELPSLTFGIPLSLDEQDLENPDLILDGNSSAFTSAVTGPIVAMLGQTHVTVNPATLMTNNRSGAPGGAFYLESFRLGDEYSPLAPTLYVNGGKISDNTSLIDGGAIAAFGNLNGSGSGEIQLNGCMITGNRVENELSEGRGGAVFSEGCRVILNSSELSSNVADLGGAVYTCYETLISNCVFKLNRAGVSGGVIYADTFTTPGSHGVSYAANVELISSYMSENSSEGEGGAITNHGKFTFAESGLSYVSDNSAVGDGAAIKNTGELILSSGQIYSNETTKGRGGIYNSGKLDFKGADLRLNSAVIGGGIYNIGTFNFTAGCTYGNKCTAEYAPQIANLGIMTMQGSFVIEKDIIGYFPIMDEASGKMTYTVTDMMGEITTNEIFSVAFYEALPEGEIEKCVLANEKGLCAFSGLSRFTKTASERTRVFHNGFGSYKVDSNGCISFVFPIMPIWAWILCIAGVAGGAFGAVFFIRKRKKADS